MIFVVLELSRKGMMEMDKKKVFVGVGHGGTDAGAVGYIVEKDVNLKMAKACRDYLLANGVDVMISRDSDVTDYLSSKISRCNKYGADVALDIHNNSGGGDGFEVFYSIVGGTGKTLAENIEKEVKALGQNSRGCKTQRGDNGDYFGFIRSTTMPAVICEGVFVDTAADAAQADTDAECQAFGRAYARGILNTLGIVPNDGDGDSSQDGAFLVKVTVKDLNIRKGAGENYERTSFIEPGVYTIVETKMSDGLVWGRLKSGSGWICLKYASRMS